MHNSAEVSSDGSSVFLISVVKPKKYAQAILIVLFIIALILYVSAIVHTLNSNPTGGAILAVFVLFPATILFPISKYLFWNLYGKEEIVVSENTINYRRSYGVLTTNWHTKKYKPLYYNIIKQDMDNDLSIIEFGGKTTRDVPVSIFKSSVKTPTRQIVKLTQEIKKIFPIEEITHKPNKKELLKIRA